MSQTFFRVPRVTSERKPKLLWKHNLPTKKVYKMNFQKEKRTSIFKYGQSGLSLFFSSFHITVEIEIEKTKRKCRAWDLNLGRRMVGAG